MRPILDDLRNKRVLVVGLGRSGRAAAQLCLDQGATVTLTDQRSEAELSGTLSTLTQRCRLELGGHQPQSFIETDLVVLSPGVPPLAEVEVARRAGVEVLGEVELASRFVRAPIVAITGTNGKSTTTELVGAMLRESGRDVFCGGNLGQPLSEVVEQDACRNGVIVLELSSFQLETVSTFRAHVAVLLNLSEDHLDRYASYDDYKRAKARIFERQTPDDFAVLNGESDQGDALALARNSTATHGIFCCESAKRQPGSWVEGSSLCLQTEATATIERYERSILSLPGRHNTLNALAALLAARLAGATESGCRAALCTFAGLPHRMQLVRERNGVRFYDDSKATNVGSVVGSLAGFERPVVLIAGGKDKGGSYEPLRKVVAKNCRGVVLIGAAAGKIATAIEGTVSTTRAATLEQAVAQAAAMGQPGDAVVLSPACSSFDMFDNYEHRGRVFAEAVRRL